MKSTSATVTRPTGASRPRRSERRPVPDPTASPLWPAAAACLEASGLKPQSQRPLERRLRRLVAYLEAAGVTDWERVGGVTLRGYMDSLAAGGTPPHEIVRSRTAARRLLSHLIATGRRSGGAFPVFALRQGGPFPRDRVERWEDLRLGPPVRAYLDWCRHVRRLQPNTLRNYADTLSQFCDQLEAGQRAAWCEVTRRDVMEFLKALDGRGLALATVTNRLAAVRGLLDYLAIHGFRPDDGSHSIKLGKKPHRLPRALSREDVARLVEAPRAATPEAMRDRALLELAYGSGLRASELCSLTLGDVDLEGRTLLVHGKGAKERIGIFGGRARDALRQYLDRGRPALVLGLARPHALLFVNARGGPLSRMGLWKIVRWASLRARIEAKVSPHTLRHSFATHLLEGGAGIEVIRELLGHESLDTTMIYTSVDVRHLKEAIQKHHPRG